MLNSSLIPKFFIIACVVLLPALSAESAAEAPQARGSLTEVLYVPKPRSALDQSHGYHTLLLKMALKAAANGRPVPRIEPRGDMVESRAVKELSQQQSIDVYWMGTDEEKERLLRAIRIPTTRGMIGFRQFIIHRNRVSDFERVHSLSDLSQKVACQGSDWPDTEVLQHADLSVTTTPVYESLFKMVQLGRCDYFPRGFHDHRQELSLRQKQYPDLISYNGIMLHYPFAVYYFTARDNQALAQWIESGLEALINEGKLLDLMQRHPLTRAAFPLDKAPPSLLLSIDNPTLPEDTNESDSRYWFQYQDFGL